MSIAQIIDLETQEEETDFLIQGIIPRLGIGILYGQSMVGKSLLCMRLAISIAHGHSFAIDPRNPDVGSPRYRGSLVYVAGEDDASVKMRLTSARKAANPDNWQFLEGLSQFPIIPVRLSSELKNAEQLEDLYGTTYPLLTKLRSEGYPPRLVCFDTMTACMEIKDENNNTEMQRLLNAYKAFGARYESFVLGVAHPDKSGKYLRGASSQKFAVDVLLRLDEKSEGKRILTIEKIKNGAPPKEKYAFEHLVVDYAPVLIPIGCRSDREQAPVKTLRLRLLDRDLVLNALRTPKLLAATATEQQTLLAEVLAVDREQTGKKKPLLKSLEKQVDRSLKELRYMNAIDVDGAGKAIPAKTVESQIMEKEGVAAPIASPPPPSNLESRGPTEIERPWTLQDAQLAFEGPLRRLLESGLIRAQD